jgi:hypothetical protein
MVYARLARAIVIYEDVDKNEFRSRLATVGGLRMLHRNVRLSANACWSGHHSGPDQSMGVL